MNRFMATLSRLCQWFTKPAPLPWTPVTVLAIGDEEGDEAEAEAGAS
jgi:hypothetical protein